ncbi:MAG: energy-coupling factor transporter ATPase [Candidatus Gastranaerophilaceae bacterium]|nr:energy-coupling factor transporter ATPase [Christensenellales bacterium]
MPIVVEKLSHTYMHKSALAVSAINDVSIVINEGEFLCIVGHTGSGKSTFIQHLNGLLLPTSGSVMVDGCDMLDKKQRQIGRRLVGMVFQYPEHQLFEETVYKDVAFGPVNMGLSEAEVKERVMNALSIVGLDADKFCGKSPFELSGGEKRRVALAGIIAMHPKYLVLDEPMAGLDPSGRNAILDTLLELQRANNTCIIMVSHSMDDIARVATRVAIFSKGALRTVGTPAEVFSDAGEIEKLGLELPHAAQLAQALRKRGVNVPNEIYRPEELLDFLKRRLKYV